MKALLTTILLLFFTLHLSAQSNLTSSMSTKDKELLVVNKMPEGDYYSVQVATVYGDVKYVGYDDRLIGALILFNPVYLYSQGTEHNLSVGVFDSYDEAATYAKKISCIFPNGPFVVGYSNGRKVAASSLTGTTVASDYKKLKSVKKWLKKQVKIGFYRVRFGYFEQPGFTPDIQAQFDELEAKGVDVIEEPFKNGRLVMSKKKFKTIDEAISFRETHCNAYTGYKMIRRYYVDEGIWLDHLNIFYECLSN